MKKVLDSNMIKLIAILAMTIDHVTWLLYPGYPKEVLPVCASWRSAVTEVSSRRRCYG